MPRRYAFSPFYDDIEDSEEKLARYGSTAGRGLISDVVGLIAAPKAIRNAQAAELEGMAEYLGPRLAKEKGISEDEARARITGGVLEPEAGYKTIGRLFGIGGKREGEPMEVRRSKLRGMATRMHEDRDVENQRSATKLKVLGGLADLAKDDPEAMAQIYGAYGGEMGLGDLRVPKFKTARERVDEEEASRSNWRLYNKTQEKAIEDAYEEPSDYELWKKGGEDREFVESKRSKPKEARLTRDQQMMDWMQNGTPEQQTIARGYFKKQSTPARGARRTAGQVAKDLAEAIANAGMATDPVAKENAARAVEALRGELEEVSSGIDQDLPPEVRAKARAEAAASADAKRNGKPPPPTPTLDAIAVGEGDEPAQPPAPAPKPAPQPQPKPKAKPAAAPAPRDEIGDFLSQ
jgi:hypothetical protein